jgi:zinc/manganese transport system substrate-binding protein
MTLVSTTVARRRARGATVAVAALGTAVALLLSGCTTPSTAPAPHRIQLVASTNVYGGVARAIAGNLIDINSIIDNSTDDPHTFEGGARVQLALSKADIIIENGAGYDSFMDTLIAGLPDSKAKVLNVADISKKTVDADFNEHLWYDFPTMEKLAAELVSTLSALSPGNAGAFQNNASAFVVELAGLEGREDALKTKYAGADIAITESVPGYMLQASGLRVVTPKKFTQAVQAGTDVAPAVLQEALGQLSDGSAQILIYNSQTTGPQTDAMRQAARVAGVPVMSVTENLPPGFTYLQWMTGNLTLLRSTLP